MNYERLKISTTVPPEHADAVREALGTAGAGMVGDYSFCSFSILGKGRFRPSDRANPYIGEAGSLQEVKEELIEVLCMRGVARHVLEVLRDAHPYEEPIIMITPLLSEDDLA